MSLHEAISSGPIRVLLVDDQDAFRDATAKRLELRGFQVSQAVDGVQADHLLRENVPDVVVCDLKMPNMDGISLMRKRIQDFPATAWIILTGQATVETAISGLKLGAAEYLQKPIDVEDLERYIRSTYERGAAARMLASVRQQLRDGSMKFGIVGRSPHLAETYEFIYKSAKSSQPVLIAGESGTGKELVARGIHEHSDQKARPFVVFNCSAVERDMQANELFGHVEGAYEGASGNKLGLVEVADGGTLFVDEIGDLSLENQAALLGLMESGQFRRLGDNKDRVVDIRVIASSEHDLSDMIEQESFRKDLFYRLNALPFELAPLRDRREDVPLLIQHFLDRHERRSGEPKRLAPEAMVALESYDWPGNVREVANVIERAATLCDDFTIRPADLKLRLPSGVATADGFSNRLDDVERQHVLSVLESHGGNKVATAKELGVSRMKLYRKLEQYGIE